MNAQDPASGLLDEAKADYDFVYPTGLVCSECAARVWQAYKADRQWLTGCLWFCNCTRSIGQIVPGTWEPQQNAEAAK